MISLGPVYNIHLDIAAVLRGMSAAVVMNIAMTRANVACLFMEASLPSRFLS